MTARRMAIIGIDLSALEQLLCLPAGCKIEHVEHDIARPDSLCLRVRGAGYEVAHGHLIPQAAHGNVRTFIVDVDGKPEKAYWVSWGADLRPEAS